MTDQDSREPTFAELLDNLFKRRLHPSGREYNYTEVITAMPAEASSQHLSQLRTGRIKNPGRKIIEGLCIFFKVPPEYFFPNLQKIQYEPLPPLPDDSVEQ